MTATISPTDGGVGEDRHLPVPIDVPSEPPASPALVAWSAAIEHANHGAVEPAIIGHLFIEAYQRTARQRAGEHPLPVPSSFAAVPALAGPLPVPALGAWPAVTAPALPAPASEVGASSGVGGGRFMRRGATGGGLQDAHRQLFITICTWLRNIGVLMILFAAWQLWGTAIAQHHAQAGLQSQFEAKVKAAPHKPVYSLVPASVQYPLPPEGTVMAHLQIPAIALDQYVVSGTAEGDLAKGPGHYIGTAMPGQAGNVAIAGHRTTHGAPFNRLAELDPGDPIYLTTVAGQRLTYIVAQTPYPVLPSNTSVLDYFGDNRLTLTTCNPEFSAAQRLIVVAEYQPPGSTGPAHVTRTSGTPVKVQATGDAGWNTGLLPLVLVELGLLVALGLFNGRLGRLLGREGRWLVLVPIWLALLFALFQSLTSFLPAAA